MGRSFGAATIDGDPERVALQHSRLHPGLAGAVPEKRRDYGAKTRDRRVPVSLGYQFVTFGARPARNVRMTDSIASWRCPFVASTCPPRDVNGSPSVFVTRPPASETMSAPPAMSH